MLQIEWDWHLRSLCVDKKTMNFFINFSITWNPYVVLPNEYTYFPIYMQPGGFTLCAICVLMFVVCIRCNMLSHRWELTSLHDTWLHGCSEHYLDAHDTLQLDYRLRMRKSTKLIVCNRQDRSFIGKVEKFVWMVLAEETVQMSTRI